MNQILTGKSSMFSILKTQLLILIILTTSSILFAQGVDSSFDPAVGRIIAESINFGQSEGDVSVQPDGKILVFGASTYVNTAGVSHRGVARLNTNGTVDSSFSCECSGFNRVTSAMAQTDGKVIVAGTASSNNRLKVARYNSDGSLDSTFTNNFTNTSFVAYVVGIQSDGKILYSYIYSSGPSQVSGVDRLNADGTKDDQFNSFGFSFNTFLRHLDVLPDDKIMVAASNNNNNKDLYRLNSNGSLDTTFEAPVLTGGNGGRYINDFAFQSDGKIVVSGLFSAINGLSRSNFARLNADGTVDTSFSQSYTGNAHLEIASNDQIIVSNDSFASATMNRLNADGTADKSFNPISNIVNFQLDASGRIVAVKNANIVVDGNAVRSNVYQEVKRFDVDGNSDNSFQNSSIGLAGIVEEMELQTDGKVLVSGTFSSVDGAFKNGIARINSDGTIDSTFSSPGVDYTNTVDGKVDDIAVQTDGKIIIGGVILSYGGLPQTGLLRLNSDGSIDNDFNTILSPQNYTSYVSTIAIQPDGKILIGGRFEEVNGTIKHSIARINPDGSLDISFNASLANSYISEITLQSNGKIMIGGSFNGISGSNRSNLARLNSDGSVDTSFNAGSSQSVYQIIVKDNGQYFVRENSKMILRNSNGTIDNSFTSPTVNSSIQKVSLQDDGTLIIVGGFYSPRSNIARLLQDGSLDTTFYATGANGSVNDILVQSDGKIIIGGSFSVFANTAHSGLARFTAPPIIPVSPTTNFDFDGDGKADIAVFRPSENKWYVLRSSDYGVTQRVWGISGDHPLPFDFDGDGRLDYSIYRGSNGNWWTLTPATGTQYNVQNGQSGDIPRPSDFDGDGRTDYVVFRPSNNTWYRRSSTGAFNTVVFGLSGDKPLVGDFDGDGKSDVAIYRPSSGDWWWQSSLDNSQRATHWGISTDIPSPGDYDGDGITDFAVYRPADGVWYIYNSSTQQATIIQFGISEDKPVPADYDGDGKVDIAVYRPSTGVWYLLRSTEGFQAIQFGISSDIPIPNALIP